MELDFGSLGDAIGVEELVIELLVAKLLSFLTEADAGSRGVDSLTTMTMRKTCLNVGEEVK